MPKSTSSDYQPDKVAQQDLDDSTEAEYWQENSKLMAARRKKMGLPPAKIWTPPKPKD